MKKILFLFILTLLPVGLYSQSGNEKVLGVIDLAAKAGVSKAEASSLTDFILDAAYKFGKEKYKIISRGQRDDLLKEHEFGSSDLCDELACALQVGKYLSADFMIIGAVTKLGDSIIFRLVGCGYHQPASAPAALQPLNGEL